MNGLFARYHSALIGVNTVITVHFSFVNSKDYCCYSQCPYGFDFLKKCFGLPAKTIKQKQTRLLC